MSNIFTIKDLNVLTSSKYAIDMTFETLFLYYNFLTLYFYFVHPFFPEISIITDILKS